MGEQTAEHESYGVLMGWSHAEIGPRLDLKLQCVQSTRCKERGEVDLQHVLMTRDQAAVLANYLFRVLDLAPPVQRRRALDRLLGR